MSLYWFLIHLNVILHFIQKFALIFFLFWYFLHKNAIFTLCLGFDEEEDREIDPEQFMMERHQQWRERQEIQKKLNKKRSPKSERHLMENDKVAHSAPSSPSRYFLDFF